MFFNWFGFLGAMIVADSHYISSDGTSARTPSLSYGCLHCAVSIDLAFASQPIFVGNRLQLVDAPASLVFALMPLPGPGLFAIHEKEE
jgi:hypothetical protein